MSAIYDVIAKRWKHGWELHIEGIGVTQAETLDKAEEMVRDYIALDLNVDPYSFEIKLRPEIGDGLDQRITEIRERRHKAEEALAKAAEDSRTLARQLAKSGLSGRDTAKVLGVTPQRVSQLLRGDRRSARSKGLPVNER